MFFGSIESKHSIVVIKQLTLNCTETCSVFWQQGACCQLTHVSEQMFVPSLVPHCSSFFVAPVSPPPGCQQTHTCIYSSFALILHRPFQMTFQRPLTLEVSWRYLLFSSKAHWWDCLALNKPSLPQQISSCISCRPVGFIDRSSPGSVRAGAGALSSSWSGHWRLLAPLAAWVVPGSAVTQLPYSPVWGRLLGGCRK